MSVLKPPTIYNIPAGFPFAQLLATALLKETVHDPMALNRYCIFLPSRRAGRILQDSFIENAAHQTLILPRIQPIGDLDEEELFFYAHALQTQEKARNIPPAISVLERSILLARLIQKQKPLIPLDQAIQLGQSLGHLLDQIYNENLSLTQLETLVPDRFAAHWQITIDFLKIISEYWPLILQERGVIDYADRRNQLILALADMWEKTPPDYPVIAAGTTGSLPATARLLSVIARLPKGRIILPGLDPDLDAKSWENLSESHPQYGFKKLFETLRADPQDVSIWPGTSFNSSLQEKRQILAREIMRPSATIAHWSNQARMSAIADTLATACKNLSVIECAHENEEALCVALALREALETPNQNIAVITPDRNLAARIKILAQRWDIFIDDTAGTPLDRSTIGQFFILLYEAAREDFSPVALLAFLKHPLCSFGLERADKNTLIQNLDMALRGTKPPSGFSGLKSYIQKSEIVSDADKESLIEFLSLIEFGYDPLITCLKNQKKSFHDIVVAHIQSAEFFSQDTQKKAERLWQSEEGREACVFFQELLTLNDLKAFHAGDIFEHYSAILISLMQRKNIRPALAIKPQVQILGLLEARMVQSDLVILCGLNENIWPAEQDPDPWMSRPMRRNFGLPALERSIGLSAHDFVQGFSNENVILTRAEKSGNAPSVPSRWLQRLDTVLKASNIDPHILRKNSSILSWARHLDQNGAALRIKRPLPMPPMDARPTKLPVTQIETWLKDPYAIYARYILKLYKLNALEKPVDAALYGTMLHTIIERFTAQHAYDMPHDAENILHDILKNVLQENEIEENQAHFWKARFSRMIHWFIAHETQWRKSARIIAQEGKGSLTINDAQLSTPFTLYGYADRIDKCHDGSAVIIDYKSGGNYTQSAVQNGDLPQLPLEALMLQKGAFANTPALNVSALQYWVLHGRQAGGAVTDISKDMPDIVSGIEEKLHHLIRTYQNPDMPYAVVPNMDKAPRYNDYEHLERISEWAVSNDEFEEVEE